jgi:thiamine phosphate synthase YjbQ (UPF0047 family)
MKLQTTALLLSGALLVGCGSSSDSTNDANNTTAIDITDGLTMIFFDNVSSKQYLYNTDTETYEDMNADETQNYDMTGRHGKPYVWFHETTAGVDQKIVMLNEDFDINEGNVTYESFQYLGHFHEENNEQHFAAHSPDEFDPDNNASAAKLAALNALSADLLEKEEIKEEIAEALPSGESLCNFFVFEHDHEEEDNETEKHEEEAAAHIALTTTGSVYVFVEQNGTLQSTQAAFALEGVSACETDKSAIVKASDYGVIIFSAQSQKLYLVDNHGMDFHQHSTWDIAKFLPAGFTPTSLASIVEEGEHDHDHEE